MTPLLSSALLRTQSDERLVALAIQGHDHAFEAIVDRYRRPLLRYLHRLLPGDRAEDVLQAALVSAWTSLRDGTTVRDLRPWLYRICHNAALNALARRGFDDAQLTDTLQGAAAPAEALEHRDALRSVFASLADLPERQRDALLAVAVQGRPHGEVARLLGMSDGALRQLVHRARSSVRSAVTAVTPAPALNWLLQLGARASAAPRMAELLGGAGIAGAAKTAVIVAVTGAVVVDGATHVIGRHAGAAVAAAAAVPRPVARPLPHSTPVVARRRTRHPARAPHAGRRHRITVALGGRTDRVVAVLPRLRRHGYRHPVPGSTLTHGDAGGLAPASSAPAAAQGTPAPDPTATTPADPAPAPAPAPCHEVACRPTTTSTEPPPPTTTEPAPPPPTTTEPAPPPPVPGQI